MPRSALAPASTIRSAESAPRGPRRGAGRRTLAAVVACCALAAAALIQAPAGSAASCSAGKCAQTFNSTGSLQAWKVPAGVSSATFAVAGAGGGGGFWFSTGGSGALVTTTFTLVEGEQLKLLVGSPGGRGRPHTISFTQPTTSVTELASSEEAFVGETVTYSATVSPVPSDGTVSFEDKGSAIPGCSAAPVSATTGEASCEAEPEEAGIDVVTAKLLGVERSDLSGGHAATPAK